MTTQDEAPKWQRVSPPFVSPATIMSPDGHKFLVYGSDALLAYLNPREQRISELEARAALADEATQLVRELFSPPAMPPSINTKGKLNWDLPEKMARWHEENAKARDEWVREAERRAEALLARYDALSTTKEEQA